MSENEEIVTELIKRKNEIIMTMGFGEQGNYTYLVLIEHKPGVFRWFDPISGNYPGLHGKTIVAAIISLLNTGLKPTSIGEGNQFF